MTANDPTLSQADIEIIAQQMVRLRSIERGAWRALELANEGRAMDAFAVLSEALGVVTYQPSRS